MKKLLLFLVLCLCGVANAGDLRATWTQTFTSTDTLGWRDSVYTDWVNVEGAQKIHFYAKIMPFKAGGIDTNFASDTFFVNAQFSFDKSAIIKTIELDTFLTTDSSWTGNDALVGDSLRGTFMRAIMISHDDADVLTSGAIVGKTYSKLLNLFYSIVK